MEKEKKEEGPASLRAGNFSVRNALITDERPVLTGFTRELGTSACGPKEKKPRTFKKHTQTWLLFVHLFLDQPASAYPVLLGPYTKGQALNLAVGLNTCHVQHMRETGMPEENMLYSAKPLRKEQDSWYIEVSTNYTRTGVTKPSRANATGSKWLQSLLAQTQAEHPSERVQEIQAAKAPAPATPFERYLDDAIKDAPKAVPPPKPAEEEKSDPFAAYFPEE